MRHQGVEFKEALFILKGNPQTPAVSAKASLRLKSKEAKPSKTPTLPEVTSFEDVADYYHRQLSSHPEAADYLKKRGIYAPELLGRLKVGYCPGDLKEKLSETPVSGAEKGRPLLGKEYGNISPLPCVSSLFFRWENPGILWTKDK